MFRRIRIRNSGVAAERRRVATFLHFEPKLMALYSKNFSHFHYELYVNCCETAVLLLAFRTLKGFGNEK